MSTAKYSLKIFVAFCLLSLFCRIHSPRANPVRVTVVVSLQAESGPVHEIVNAITEELKSTASGAQVTLLSLEKDVIGNQERLQKKLSEADGQVIVAVGSKLAKAIQALGLEQPVVFTMVLGAAQSGLSPPGVSLDISYQQKIQRYSQIAGPVSRIGVFYSDESQPELDRLKEACALLNCEVIAHRITNETELPAATGEIMNDIQLFVITPDAKIFFPKAVENVLAEALKRRVPVLGLSESYTKAGALVSFECDYADLGKQTANIVVELLQGGHADKVLAPERILYSVNVQVGKRIGINIADPWVKSAAKVFGQ